MAEGYLEIFVESCDVEIFLRNPIVCESPEKFRNFIGIDSVEV